MEQQLFTWDGWDKLDDRTLMFYDVITVVELPGIPKGTKFYIADIDYDVGKLQFWNDTGGRVIHTFDLLLTVSNP